jgi:hypothetical protein
MSLINPGELFVLAIVLASIVFRLLEIHRAHCKQRRHRRH